MSRTTRPLYAYQSAVVQTMQERECRGYVPVDDQTRLDSTTWILSGAPGCGKTTMALELVARAKQTEARPSERSTRRDINSHMFFSCRQRVQCVGTTLLVADSNIRSQWEAEVKTHYADTVRSRRVETATVKAITDLVADLDTLDLVIVSETVLRKLLQRAPDVEYWRLIIDEADSIRLHTLPAIHARMVWLVSATWHKLLAYTKTKASAYSDRSLLSRLLRAAPLPYLVVGPEVVPTNGYGDIHEHTHTYVDSGVVHAIRRFVSPDVVHMLESGNVEGAMLALNGVHNTSKSLLDVLVERTRETLADAQFRLDRAGGREDTDARVHWEGRVRAAQERLAGIQSSVQQIAAGEEPCSICMDTMDHPVLTQCLHLFCMRCLVTWQETSLSCPTCRSAVRMEYCHTFAHMSDERPPASALTSALAPAAQEPATARSRLEALRTLLTGLASDARILLFARHDCALAGLLDEHPFEHLHGSSFVRTRLLEAFRTGQIRILLLNSDVASSGLHLPEATDVVLFHELDPTVQVQAIGRAYRPGRTGPLNVHHIHPTRVVL